MYVPTGANMPICGMQPIFLLFYRLPNFKDFLPLSEEGKMKENLSFIKIAFGSNRY